MKENIEYATQRICEEFQKRLPEQTEQAISAFQSAKGFAKTTYSHAKKHFIYSVLVLNSIWHHGDRNYCEPMESLEVKVSEK